MATHSSILAWRIPMDRGAWWAVVHGVTKLDTIKWLGIEQLGAKQTHSLVFENEASNAYSIFSVPQTNIHLSENLPHLTDTSHIFFNLWSCAYLLVWYWKYLFEMSWGPREANYIIIILSCTSLLPGVDYFHF